MQAAIRVQDRTVIEIDPNIAKQSGVKDGQLFEQELTSDGNILLRRLLPENSDRVTSNEKPLTRGSGGLK